MRRKTTNAKSQTPSNVSPQGDAQLLTSSPDLILGFFPARWLLAIFICPVWPSRERSSIIETEMTAEQKSALAGVVTIDEGVMHGTPCFAQTRVPVQTLIDFLETGETIDDFLAVYPTIHRRRVFSFLELSCVIAIDQLECASS